MGALSLGLKIPGSRYTGAVCGNTHVRASRDELYGGASISMRGCVLLVQLANDWCVELSLLGDIGCSRHVSHRQAPLEDRWSF